MASVSRGARSSPAPSLRDALIDHGLALLQREGLDALTMRRVARDLGVSATAPIHHFPTLATYQAALATRGFEMQYDARASSLRADADPADRLLEVMMVKLRFAREHGPLFQLMYGPVIADKHRYPALQAAAMRTYRLLEECVHDYLASRGASAGTSRGASEGGSKDAPTDASGPAEAAVYAAWTACHGVACILADRPDNWGPIGRRDPLKLGRQVLRVVIAGLPAAV